MMVNEEKLDTVDVIGCARGGIQPSGVQTVPPEPLVSPSCLTLIIALGTINTTHFILLVYFLSLSSKI